MSDCRRTPGLIDRLVDGRATDDDRRHAAGCSTCGPVLARAAAFDDELRRSARALVAEELPRGILDQPLSGRAPGVVSRRPVPGLAAILAAVAILSTATLIALAPGTGPTPTPTSSPSATAAPTPTAASFVERFRSTAAIVGQLTKLGYACNDGPPLSSVGPEADAVVKEAAVCSAPGSVGPFLVAVIVGEAANGKVVELTLKSDLIADTTENRTLLAMGVAKVFALSLLDEGAGQNGASWAKAHLPEMNVGDSIDVTLRQVSFHAERAEDGSYRIVVRGVRPG